MSVRNKLSLQFTIIVASIFLIAFVIILMISTNYRQSEFEGRLEEKATHTARLLLDIEEVDSTLLTKIDQRSYGSLIDERLTIMSDDGIVLYSTDDQNRLGVDEAEIKALQNDTIVKYVNGDLEVLGLRYLSGSQPYFIFIGGYDKFGKRKIINLQFTLLLTWICCVIIVAWAGWWYAGRALKPVSEIISEVDQINEKNLETRINEGNGKDELARLAATFNNMLNRLENSIKLEKTFLSNASHELRNPLAAITSQLEVCLLSDRKSDEYISTLKSVLEDIKSLNQLSHQLLLLTRIEAGFANQQFTSERIDQLIFDACEVVSRSGKGIRIDFRFMEDIHHEEKWSLQCSRELILSAFQNIIENAAKFGATDLIIEHRFTSGEHVIAFIDNGVGIIPEDRDKIFDSFFRSKTNDETKGYGIGLSLVSRILTLHGGSIAVNTERGPGATFEIKLPGS